MLKESELNQLGRSDTESYRRSKNFVRQLFWMLLGMLNEKEYHKIISATRIPNERELYGIFARVLGLVCSASKMPLLSEFSVTRNEANGRVDFISFYRGTAFFIEIKVARIVNRRSNFSAEIEVDEDDDQEITGSPVQKVAKPWISAVTQLSEDVEVDFLSLDGVGQVIKLPLVLYFHTDYRGAEKVSKAERPSLTAEYILKQLDSFPSEVRPSFATFAGFATPFQTRKRHDQGPNQQRVVNVYGYTLLAGCPQYLN